MRGRPACPLPHVPPDPHVPHVLPQCAREGVRTDVIGGTGETCGKAPLPHVLQVLPRSLSLGLGQLRQKRPRGDDGWPPKGEAIDILEGQCEGNLKRMRRLKGVLNGEEGFGERR